MIKRIRKSEWFVFSKPFEEPDANWSEDESYNIERIVKSDGEVIWFGLNTNWTKKPNGNWQKLVGKINQEGEREFVFEDCQIPAYEKLRLEMDDNIDLNAVEFAKWLQHLDNGETHYNPFKKEKTDSIGFSPFDCLNDGVYSVEELYKKWKNISMEKPKEEKTNHLIDDKYKKIQNEENYNILLKSGMFWEFHPELSGNWEKDKNIIQGKR